MPHRNRGIRYTLVLWHERIVKEILSYWKNRHTIISNQSSVDMHFSSRRWIYWKLFQLPITIIHLHVSQLKLPNLLIFFFFLMRVSSPVSNRDRIAFEKKVSNRSSDRTQTAAYRLGLEEYTKMCYRMPKNRICSFSLGRELAWKNAHQLVWFTTLCEK